MSAPRERDWFVLVVAAVTLAVLFGVVLLALADPH